LQMTGHSSDEKPRLVGQMGMEAKAEDRACTRVSEDKEAPDMKQLRTEVRLWDKATLARSGQSLSHHSAGDEGAATAWTTVRWPSRHRACRLAQPHSSCCKYRLS
jgi:hypothetical protein